MEESYPIVDLDSDKECADSSEDEIDVLLHGTPEQRRRMRRRSLGKKSSSSEDEFEKEMAAELDATLKGIEQKQNIEVGGDGPSTSQPSTTDSQFYSQDYFDSDSDEEGTSEEKKHKQHPIPSNDDLLYDPDLDEEDQRWIDRHRQRYLPRLPPGRGRAKQRGTGREGGPKPLPHSDAVLNCPACMSLLCLDCQRHAKYTHQFRAMFVVNCSVDHSERLCFPEEKAKNNRNKLKKKNKRQKVEDTVNTDIAPETINMDTAVRETDDVYHPVRCTECTTQVGVFDKDEVYHFFNVLSSYS